MKKNYLLKIYHNTAFIYFDDIFRSCAKHKIGLNTCYHRCDLGRVVTAHLYFEIGKINVY